MSINWEEYDKNVDIEGLKKDIKESAENGNNFKEVPHADYEVTIEKMELVKSKKGDPMLSIWFKIIDGEYKNSKIFMNQLVRDGFGIHIANEFMRSLDTGIDIEFNGYGDYNNLILDVFEAMDGVEFALEYGENSKGFNTFEVLEIF